MNNLIKVNYDGESPVVSGRELHKFCEATERYSNWFERVCQYGFVEGIDYAGCKVFNTLANQELQDHAMSLNMAKEVAMIQRTEKGKQARQYFIAIEKEWRNRGAYQIPKTMSEALRLAADQAERIEAQDKLIEEQKPMVEFFYQVADSKNAIDIGSAAKVLDMGIGRNGLFEILRDAKVLMSNNQPYQKYIDMGYFRTIAQTFTKPDGSLHTNTKTVVYPRGLDFIRKLLLAA